jgi:hypothetical protein
MTRLTKKQRQQLFLEEFLRRVQEAPPGERVYMAVGDLFETAEVQDLDKVRTARRTPVDRSGEEF